MALVVQCGACQKKFGAPDHLAGQAVKCPGCQARIDIPPLDSDESGLIPLAEAVPPAAKRSSPKSKPAPAADDELPVLADPASAVFSTPSIDALSDDPLSQGPLAGPAPRKRGWGRKRGPRIDADDDAPVEAVSAPTRHRSASPAWNWIVAHPAIIGGMATAVLYTIISPLFWFIPLLLAAWAVVCSLCAWAVQDSENNPKYEFVVNTDRGLGRLWTFLSLLGILTAGFVAAAYWRSMSEQRATWAEMYGVSFQMMVLAWSLMALAYVGVFFMVSENHGFFKAHLWTMFLGNFIYLCMLPTYAVFVGGTDAIGRILAGYAPRAPVKSSGDSYPSRLASLHQGAPLTNEEAKEFGVHLAKLSKTQKFDEILASFDREAFWELVRSPQVAGEAADHEGYAKFTAVAANTLFRPGMEMLRVHERYGQKSVVLRSESGKLDFIYFILIRRQNKVVAVDMESLLRGERFSESRRRVFLQDAAAQDAEVSNRVQGLEMDWLVHAEKLVAFEDAAENKRWIEVLQVASSLPPSLKNSKFCLARRIEAASALAAANPSATDSQQAAALKELRLLARSDPTYDLLWLASRNSPVDRKQAMASIDSLLTAVGNDPKLNAMRAELEAAIGQAAVAPQKERPQAAWQAEPDPGAKLPAPVETSRAIPHPERFFGGGEILVSTAAVAVGKNLMPASQRTIYSLENKGLVGKLQGDIDLGAVLVLSPSGRSLASLAMTGDKVDVWSCERGEIETSMVLGLGGRAKSLAYLNETHLLATSVNTSKQRCEFLVFKIKEAEPITQYSFSGAEVSPFSATVAVSAGGRYLGVPLTDRLAILDASSGEVKGECGLTGPHKLKVPPELIRFSPDGEYVSCFSDTGSTAQLTTFSMKTGEEFAHHEFAFDMRKLSRSLVAPFSWLPDSQGWFLFERILVPLQPGRKHWARYNVLTKGEKDWEDLRVPFIHVNGHLVLSDHMHFYPNVPLPEGKTLKVESPTHVSALFDGDLPPEVVRLAGANVFDPPVDRPADLRTDIQKYVHDAHVNLIANSGEPLKKALRTWPAGKRPVIGIRWGLGITAPKQAVQPNVDRVEGLESLTGIVGPRIGERLQALTEQGRFGEWPKTTDERLRAVTFMGGALRKDHLRFAREQRIDAIALIELTMEVGALGRSRDVVMRTYLIDTATDADVWRSEPLSSNKVGNTGPKLAETYVEGVLQQISDRFTLKDMPALTADVAQQRCERIAESKPARTLPVAAEIRYYQANGLISDQAATGYFEKLLGPGQGAIATAPPDQVIKLLTSAE